MRQHGINLPDPLFSGGNIVQRTPDRAVRNSAKVKAAEQACKQYLPHGPPTQADSQMLQQMLAFARCMRQHGINLPDPQKTEQGQQLPPGMSRNDPRLKAAEQACGQQGGGVASEDAEDARVCPLRCGLDLLAAVCGAPMRRSVLADTRPSRGPGRVLPSAGG